jgi:hypothetical protein
MAQVRVQRKSLALTNSCSRYWSQGDLDGANHKGPVYYITIYAIVSQEVIFVAAMSHALFRSLPLVSF